MSTPDTMQETTPTTVTSKPDSLTWLLPFLGQGWIIVSAGTLIFGGIRDIIWTTLFLVAVAAFVAFVNRSMNYSVADLSDEGVTLRPLWKWRVGAAPFQFSWSEVKEIKRAGFKPGKTRAVWVILDRPHRFWTFKAARRRVGIPDDIASHPRFIELASKHVPTWHVWADSLSHHPRAWRILHMISAAMTGISALALSWCALRLESGIAGFRMTIFMVPVLVAALGGVASIILLASSLSTFRSGLLYGTACGLTFGLSMMVIIAMTIGNVGILVAFMAATAGLLFGVACLFLRTRPLRASGVALCYALALVGGAIGYFGYGGVPSIPVANGTLPYPSPWTPQGDAFLVLETTESPEAVSTTARWYSADLTPGHQVILAGEPYVKCVGAQAALATIEAADGKDRRELWWLPRVSGEARLLLVADYVRFFPYAMDPQGNTAILKVEDDEQETWQQCNLTKGELVPIEVPAQPDDVRRMWIGKNGTLRWLTGSTPEDERGHRISPETFLANPSSIQEPGQRFEIWEWQNGAEPEPRRIYQADAEWLDFKTGIHEPRIGACQIKPGEQGSVEYIQVEISPDAPETSEITEEVFNHYHWQFAKWNLTLIPQPESSEMFQPFLRVAATNKATGERKLLRNSPGFFGLSVRFWSPNGESFLYTGAKLGFGLRWKRDRESDPGLAERVYIVNLANN